MMYIVIGIRILPKDDLTICYSITIHVFSCVFSYMNGNIYETNINATIQIHNL
jgi:hypothetical protein